MSSRSDEPRPKRRRTRRAAARSSANAFLSSLTGFDEPEEAADSTSILPSVSAASAVSERKEDLDTAVEMMSDANVMDEIDDVGDIYDIDIDVNMEEPIAAAHPAPQPDGAQLWSFLEEYPYIYTATECESLFDKWDVLSLDSEEGQRRLREWIIEVDLDEVRASRGQGYATAVRVIREMMSSSSTLPGRLSSAEPKRMAFPFRSKLQFMMCWKYVSKMWARSEWQPIIDTLKLLLANDYFEKSKSVGAWDFPTDVTIKSYLKKLFHVEISQTEKISYTGIRGYETKKPGVWALPKQILKTINKDRKANGLPALKLTDEEIAARYYTDIEEEIVVASFIGPLLMSIATENGIQAFDFDCTGDESETCFRTIDSRWAREYESWQSESYYFAPGHPVILCPSIMRNSQNEIFFIFRMEKQYNIDEFMVMTGESDSRFGRDIAHGDFRHVTVWHCHRLYPRGSIDVYDMDDDDDDEVGHDSSLSDYFAAYFFTIDLDESYQFKLGARQERGISVTNLIDDAELDQCEFVNPTLSTMQTHIIGRIYDEEDAEWNGSEEIESLAPFLLQDAQMMPEQLKQSRPYVFLDVGWDSMNVTSFAHQYQSCTNVLYKWANHVSQRGNWIPYTVLKRHIPVWKAVQLLMRDVESLSEGIPAIFHLKDSENESHLGIGLLFGDLYSVNGDKEAMDDYMNKRRSNKLNRADGPWNIGGVGVYGKCKLPDNFQVCDGRFLLSAKAYSELKNNFISRILKMKKSTHRSKFLREIGFSSLPGHLEFLFRTDVEPVQRFRFNWACGTVPDIAHMFGGHGIIGVMVREILARIPLNEHSLLSHKINAFLRFLKMKNPGIQIPRDCSFTIKAEKMDMLQYIARALYFGIAVSHIWPGNRLIGCLRMMIMLFSDAFKARSSHECDIFQESVRNTLRVVEEVFEEFGIEDKLNIPKIRQLITLGYITLPLFRSTTVFNSIRLERAHQYPKRVLAFHCNHRLPANRAVLDRLCLEMNFACMLARVRWGSEFQYQVSDELLDSCRKASDTSENNFIYDVPSPLNLPRTVEYGLTVQALRMSLANEDMDERKAEVMSTFDSYFEEIKSTFESEEAYNAALKLYWIRSFQINNYHNSAKFQLKRPSDDAEVCAVVFCRDTTSAASEFICKIKFGFVFNFNDSQNEKKFGLRNVRQRYLTLFYGDCFRVHWVEYGAESGSAPPDYFEHYDPVAGWCNGWKFDESVDYIRTGFIPANVVQMPTIILHDCKYNPRDVNCQFTDTTRLSLRREVVTEMKAEDIGADDADADESSSDEELESAASLSAASSLRSIYMDGEVEEEKKSDADVEWQCKSDENKRYGLLTPDYCYQPRLFGKIIIIKYPASNHVRNFDIDTGKPF